MRPRAALTKKTGTERPNSKLLTPSLAVIVVAVHPKNPEAQLKNLEAQRTIVNNTSSDSVFEAGGHKEMSSILAEN